MTRNELGRLACDAMYTNREIWVDWDTIPSYRRDSWCQVAQAVRDAVLAEITHEGRIMAVHPPYLAALERLARADEVYRSSRVKTNADADRQLAEWDAAMAALDQYPDWRNRGKGGGDG